MGSIWRFESAALVSSGAARPRSSWPEKQHSGPEGKKHQSYDSEDQRETPHVNEGVDSSVRRLTLVIEDVEPGADRKPRQRPAGLIALKSDTCAACGLKGDDGPSLRERALLERDDRPVRTRGLVHETPGIRSKVCGYGTEHESDRVEEHEHVTNGVRGGSCVHAGSEPPSLAQITAGPRERRPSPSTYQ
jgi:hypothetical protein